MFNFMLIVFGIFAAAVVNALDKNLPSIVVAGLCFIAAALAIVFTLLDRRNRDLVWLGEDVLVELERRSIFGCGTISGRYDKEVVLGILWRQSQEERAAKRGIVDSALQGKHRIWLPWIGYLIGTIFFAAGVLYLLVPSH
jgi:hypothetical protein